MVMYPGVNIQIDVNKTLVSVGNDLQIYVVLHIYVLTGRYLSDI